jgi:flagellar FliJ protein
MTTELQSLEMLLKQAETERNEALARLQDAQQRAQAAQAQSEQLASYRASYQQRWSQQFATRGAIEIVHCYQGFHDRLDQAIGQAQQAAARSAEQLAQMRALLQERELRVASVRKLIERRRLELRRVEERRDQKLTDEAAQRSGWNNALPSRMASPMFDAPAAPGAAQPAPRAGHPLLGRTGVAWGGV